MSALPVEDAPTLRHLAAVAPHVEEDDGSEAWQIELDRIELDVLRGERTLARGRDLRTDPWDQPEDLGPLPRALLERATGLVRRQQALLEAMSERVHDTLRQQLLAETMVRTAPRPDPVYVDIST